MQLPKTLVLAALASAGLANLDSVACDGIGACINSSNCNYQGGYACAGVGDLTDQQAASAKVDMFSGLSIASRATDEEFPTDCDLNNPSASSVKIKLEKFDATFYGYIDYSCTETTLVTDCYNSFRNPSIFHLCKVIKQGVTCTPQGVITSPSAC